MSEAAGEPVLQGWADGGGRVYQAGRDQYITHYTSAVSAPGGCAPLRVDTLVADRADFIGRERELAWLRSALPPRGENAAVVISAIGGIGGVGKTALAVHAAHQFMDRFPDLRLYVDLHGYDPAGQPPTAPTTVLGELLHLLGVPPDRVPAGLEARAAMFRNLLASRQVLLVLDNARDEQQVRPLLPGSPGCFVLVTSRNRLSGLEAKHLDLDVFSEAEALALLKQIVGDDRVGAEPRDAADICHLVGYLGLGLSVAAHKLRSRPTWTLASYAARLRSEHGRLRELSVGDRAVAAAFAVSYNLLPKQHQRLFRLLASHPGAACTPHSTAALLNASPQEAEDLLEGLLDQYMVQQREHGRYHMHDLLRAFAQMCADAEDASATTCAAVERLACWYLVTAHAARRFLFPTDPERTFEAVTEPRHPLPMTDSAQALSWCEAERKTLTALVRATAEAGLDNLTWQIPWVLFSFFRLRGHYGDWVSTHLLALKAAERLDHPAARANTLNNLGLAYWRLRRLEDAIACYEQALPLHRAVGNQVNEANSLTNLGLVYSELQRYDQAIAYYRRALHLRWETGDRQGEGTTLNNLGLVYVETGRYDESLACFQQALLLHQQTGVRLSQGITLDNIGIVYRDTGLLEEALTNLLQALDIRRDMGDREGVASTLKSLGDTYLRTGDKARARNCWTESAALYDDLSSPEAAEVRKRLSDDDAI
ncbi:ATP-binding protein [Streptomyces sp. NPDC020412]|uniref:ATP-binding protein n=1 Tax=Streptomyces sp. NPDC020412 TaxID=3365073 RepID=UPI00378A3493